MEKVCEFCKSLRPIVYCKADSAHLCLSCDAKVHSANALSYRHPRTLVCESCRNRAARVRCVDHQMFMCQSCDSGSHRVSSRHRKKVIRSYVGCPSAKDLAVLWGFDLNQLESKLGDKDEYQSVYSSSISIDSGVVATSNVRKVSFEEGSNIRGKMVLKDENRQQTTCSILQQIVDLERKLAKGSDDSCLVHVKDRMDGLSFEYDGNRKVHKTLGNHAEDHLGWHTDHQNMANLVEETTEEPFLMSFSQLDQLTSTESPIHGESFWQCKTDAHNSEIWLQNMQDLGVCDEMRCFDDVNIPDVDLTFRNFEEIFGNDQQEIAGTQVGAKSTDCYISKEHSATSKFNSSCASTTKDASRPSSSSYLMQQSYDVTTDFDFSDKVHRYPTSKYSQHPTKLSYSTSFSVSRTTSESTDSESKDDEIAPRFPEPKLSNGSFDSDNTRLDGKENVIMRYKEKKILRHEKQGHYKSQKTKADGKISGKKVDT
ncbi:putative zinc finger protein At1g68190 isoform X2 [Primulina huaijiensis]|uniref:putative zinc finger protein At1g68190 isoform X2 n=1 Tax=Primulina huaijiensis TaxID=1492673 RepID=UPI003CC72179